MRRAHADAIVDLPPDEALARFADVRGWGAFVDGFARVVEGGESWPTPGAEIVWESNPGGRGRVRERVEAHESPPPAPDVAPQSDPGRLVTRVEDSSLTGTQTATFAPHPSGALFDLALDYELAGAGPLSGLTDLLFIRRAIRDSLRRTVEAFAAAAGGAGGGEPGGPPRTPVH